MTGPARGAAPTLTLPRKRGGECDPVRLEPVGSLPPRLLAEGGAELGQARIGGREAKRSSGLALLVRIVNIVVSRVDLDGAGQGVVPVAIGIAESPKVHLPEIEAGLAIDDPFRHRPAHAARTGDAMGAEACCDIQPANGRFAENEFVVRRERLGSIDQLDDIAVLERRDSLDGILGTRLETAPPLGEQPVLEVGSDAVETPWCGI